MRIPISMKVESDNSRWNVFFSFARNCVRTQHIYTIYGRVSCTFHALVVGRVHAWCLLPACLTLCSPNFSRFHVQQTQKEKNCLTNIPTYEGVRCKRAPWICFHISHTVQNAVCEKLALRERTVTRPQSSMCFFTVVFLLSNKNMEFSDHKKLCVFATHRQIASSTTIRDSEKCIFIEVDRIYFES